jgi:Domain of unknown function (DUF4185)
MRRTLIAGVLLLTGSLAPVAQGRAATIAAPPALRVTGVRQIAQLIGPLPSNPLADMMASAHSINDTIKWGVCSGDLGSLIYLNGTAYLTLGDNYTSCPPGTGGPGDLAPPDWRSNAIGIIPNPANFQHGLHITRWYSHDGKHAAEVIPSAHNAGDCQDTGAAGCEVTAIPTYGFASQGHLFLAYMSVHHWGAASQWQVNYSSFATSAGAGHTWTVEKNTVQWDAHSNFAQVAVTPDPDQSHLLLYGIPGGRFGAVKLMRVANNWRSVLSKSAYQYFTGTDAHWQPQWSKDQSRATVVASAPVGELSVIYDPGLKLWLMTYLQGGNDQIRPASDDIVIRTAPSYWGPWSSPATLVSHAQFPGLYGAFMNPRFLANRGRDVYFTMSEWGPYAVFWMRATLTPR